MHQVGGAALGMGGVMSVRCNCGNPMPIMVIFSTSGGVPATCPQCHTEFIVAKIMYDINRPNQMALGLGFKAPPITLADMQDIKELSRGGKPS